MIDLAPIRTRQLDWRMLARAEQQISDMFEVAELTRRNYVQATIIRGDGSVELLGFSPNLRTNDGADWQAGAMGGLLGSSLGSPATGSGATSLTATGTPLVANAYKGRRVRTGVDTYGNVVSNTTSAFTVDQWWTVADGVASTPGTSAPYTIDPGYAPGRFIGLTTDTGAPSAADASLASEITTNGGARALGLYAHTASATTYTLTKTFAFTGTFSLIHKVGCFTALTGGLMVFESVLNADASVISGDSMAFTWTVTNT